MPAISSSKGSRSAMLAVNPAAISPSFWSGTSPRNASVRCIGRVLAQRNEWISRASLACNFAAAWVTASGKAMATNVRVWSLMIGSLMMRDDRAARLFARTIIPSIVRQEGAEIEPLGEEVLDPSVECGDVVVFDRPLDLVGVDLQNQFEAIVE